MPGDRQTGHQEGLALGFLMKKYEGACRVGTGVGDGVKENRSGSATYPNSGFEVMEFGEKDQGWTWHKSSCLLAKSGRPFKPPCFGLRT